MLQKIKLTNFRRHTDLTVEFGPGINAIRAANERGKTSALQAWAYLFFGARALNEPLEDVVTYGTPVGKLKVEGWFDQHGVDYHLTRSKSGAELKFGKNIVTGQTEVTKYIEQLFGANADMAGKLMIAAQAGLRGALDEGPKAASEMIEFLADFDLFDRIIDLIQTKLPNGGTAAVEGRIELLKKQGTEMQLVAVKPLELAVAGARVELESAKQVVVKLEGELDVLDISTASQILADQKHLDVAVAQKQEKVSVLQAAVDAVLPAAPAAGEIEAMRAKVEAQKGVSAAVKLHAELKAADTAVLWDEPLAALHDAIQGSLHAVQVAQADTAQADAALRDAERAVQHFKSDRQLAIARLEGKLIQDESCAFCGKDLKDIPEVALNNNPLYAQIKELKAKAAPTTDKESAWLLKCQAAESDARSTLLDLKDVDFVNAKLAPLYARAAAFITLDESTVPAQWTWTGPTDAPQDFTGDLAALEAREREAVRAAAQREEQVKQLAGLKAELEINVTELGGLQIAEAKDTLVQAEALRPKLVEARQALETKADAHALAQSALTTAELANRQAAKAEADGKAQLAGAEAELLEMQANNALIRKIRAARPQVIDQLWNIVLAAVSKYCGQIRGETSVITRADGAFKINGNPVAGLSGSAKDALGLSIRIALTKTFLPASPFMILDEAAAACDDERETAMLGLLATIDFDQIILVTHSELADSFADNIITL